MDDWGIAFLDPAKEHDLFEVVEERYGYCSPIISSQVPLKMWYELFEDITVADAILDRLVNNSYRFELNGQSKRRVETGEQKTIGIGDGC